MLLLLLLLLLHVLVLIQRLLHLLLLVHLHLLSRGILILSGEGVMELGLSLRLRNGIVSRVGINHSVTLLRDVYLHSGRLLVHG